VNRLQPDPPRQPETLAEEQDEFTKEGAPPPGVVATDLSAPSHGTLNEPRHAYRPILSLSRAASLRRQHRATATATP
jgi:hypothetical protein